jgi:hypothetical protein
LLTIIGLWLWCGTLRSQEIALPAGAQFPLFLKIMAFDQHWRARVENELVIAIVYQKKFKTSLNAKEAMARAIDESSVKKIDGVPIRYVTIDLSDGNDLAEVISRDSVDILYVTPLRAFSTERIAEVSRAKQKTTWTGVPDYAESGIAVGIGIRGQKPLIIINLPAARAEGANFSSKLLALAKVIE